MRRLVLCAALLMGAGSAQADTLWASLSAPVSGPSQAIGGPASGCLAGAVALPLDGDGYQVLRPQRNRFWAHTSTVDFIAGLAQKARQSGIAPLLIGDMSQPRGGPMPFGHGSHQNGLDVDIWFRLAVPRLDADQLAQPKPVSMVKGTHVNPATWSEAHLKLLELAAKDGRVDRIFVNPPIKVAACKSAGNDRAWLSKLRPWWGHDEHFHVRLACPPQDEQCMAQAKVAEGDGCGAELTSWNAKPTLIPETARDKPNGRRYVLPVACDALRGQQTQIGRLGNAKD